MIFIIKTRVYRIIVVLLVLVSIPPPGIGEAAWVRTRPGQMTPEFWVNTSRYVDRQVVVSPARTIPAVTERQWVQTAPARAAVGHWETTERRWVQTAPARAAVGHWDVQRVWVQTAPAVPEQGHWQTVTVTPGHHTSVWVPPVMGSQWVQTAPAIPAQGHWQTVEVSPGRYVSFWVPPETTVEDVLISPEIPESGHMRTVVVSPGFWSGAWELVLNDQGFETIAWIPYWVDPVTEEVWVQTSPAIPERWGRVTVVVSPGYWDSEWVPPVTSTSWVQTAPAVPAQGHWQTVTVTPGHYTSVWVPAVTRTDWVQTAPAIPAQGHWQPVAGTPGHWTSVWVPPVTVSQWGVWESFVITPGGWVEEIRGDEEVGWRWVEVWVPPVMGTRWVHISPATPARYEVQWMIVGAEESWYNYETGRMAFYNPIWGWGTVRVANPIPWNGQWREIVVTPGRWTSVWVPPVPPPSVWVETSPAIPEQWGWVDVVIGTSSVPLASEWRWVETSPAIQARAAQTEWRNVEISPGRHENAWIPPRTQTRLVQTSPGIPAVYNTTVVTVSPARVEDTWIPPVIRTEMVQTSPAVPPTYTTAEVIVSSGRWEETRIPPVVRAEMVQISEATPPVYTTREVMVSPGRTYTTSIPPVTRTEMVQVSPAVPAVWHDRLHFAPSTTVWVETAPAVPARFETRTVVVSPGYTIPAVTEQRWVQTSPAVAGRPAEGHLQTVVLEPARTEVRWSVLFTITGIGRLVPYTVTIPAVTITFWVQTSPAVPAQPAQGHMATVMISPARVVPQVTRTESVLISPAVPAQGRFVTTPGAVTVIGQLLVSEARPAVYAERTVTVTQGRTETVTIPAVTRMEPVRISNGTPAQFRTIETEIMPGRVERTWIPEVTRMERVRVSNGIPAQFSTIETEITPGRWASVLVPPVTTTQTVRVAAAIPPVYAAVEETIPGRYERIWIPAVTEHRLVEVAPAIAGQLAQGSWQSVALGNTRWVETAPAVAAQGELRDVVVSPAVTVPAVTTTEPVWSTSGHWESLSGTITVERDRDYIFTSRWRALGRHNDMGLTINYALNRTVVGVQAVHVLHRYQNMGHLFVRPDSQVVTPGRIVLGFNYPHPGQVTSTLSVTLSFAGGETFEFEMQIPVNGIVVSQHVGLEQESFNRSVARVGTITIP